MFWNRPKIKFLVTLELDGRHPYRKEVEFQGVSRETTVVVEAKNFNKASGAALNKIVRDPETVAALLAEGIFWSAFTTKVEYVKD